MFCLSRCEVDLMPDQSPISRIDLLNKISGKDGLFCLLTDKIDHEVLEKAGNEIKIVILMPVLFKLFLKTQVHN